MTIINEYEATDRVNISDRSRLLATAEQITTMLPIMEAAYKELSDYSTRDVAILADYNTQILIDQDMDADSTRVYEIEVPKRLGGMMLNGWEAYNEALDASDEDLEALLLEDFSESEVEFILNGGSVMSEMAPKYATISADDMAENPYIATAHEPLDNPVAATSWHHSLTGHKAPLTAGDYAAIDARYKPYMDQVIENTHGISIPTYPEATHTANKVTPVATPTYADVLSMASDAPLIDNNVVTSGKRRAEGAASIIKPTPSENVALYNKPSLFAPIKAKARTMFGKLFGGTRRRPLTA